MKLLAIDGNSLAHRAHHAYERTNMRTPDGRATWATYGFLALLCGIIEKTAPDALVVGFDSRRNFRKDRAPFYKAQRSAKSPELYEQMEDMQRILKTLNVSVISPEGWEADDVIGSASRAAEAAGGECVIATSDRDSFSLITEKTSVLRLVSGLDNAVLLTPQALFDKYGIHPHQYTQYAAIRGDASDNLPGIKGVGEKGAASFLTRYGTMEEALKDEAALLVALKGTAKKILDEEARHNFKVNMDIMSINCALPVDVEEARINTTEESIQSVIDEYALRSLGTRLRLSLCPAAAMPAYDVPPEGMFDVPPPSEEDVQRVEDQYWSLF